MLKHSFSSVKDFAGCARRFHQVRILKRFKSEATDATLYGERVHKAFELYLTAGTLLPEDLARHRPLLDELRASGREIHCEKKLGVTDTFEPCEFFAEKVWFRGIPDLLMFNEERTTAWIGDWKTGKSARFADTSQLELMAALIMANYPTVQRVRGMLVFVVAGTTVSAAYTRSQLSEIWSKWIGQVDRIAQAMDNDVWNASPSGLCRFCPVTKDACEHR